MGFEPMTSSLPRMCSTPEPQQLNFAAICSLFLAIFRLKKAVFRFGAGRGNRTLVASLEGWCFTTKLHPH
jgi:hypothetical protein